MSKTLKYLLFTFISAYLLQILACHNIQLGTKAGSATGSHLVALCMLMPTVGAMIAGEKIRFLGWDPDFSDNKKLILLAWLLPTASQLLGAALYFMVFPGEFDMSGTFLKETDPIAFELLEESGESYNAYVIRQIFLSFTSPHLVIAALLGLGEEIGWRGFLFPRLKLHFGRTKGLLIGGIIHGSWHFPLMLLIGYEYGTDYIGAPVLGLFAFCIFTTATGIVSDFLYEKSQCILLPALFHGTINSAFNAYLLSDCTHPERSVFGPIDIGLISVIPMLLFAVNILYRENKRESMEFAQL